MRNISHADLPLIEAKDGCVLTDAQKSKILSYFLKKDRQKGNTVWDEGSTHSIYIRDSLGKDHEYVISFPRKLVYRSKKIADTNKKVARYDLVGDSLGEGAFGKVYDVLATFSHLRNGQMHVNTKTEYVIKYQNHLHNKNPPQDALNEAEKIKLPHLGGKDITFRKEKEKIIESYLVMRKLKNKLLFDVIDNDNSGTQLLGTEERFQLTINILRAYVEQIWDHNITHRDIKDLNIMVDMNTLLAYIFDLGFAVYSDNPNDGKSPGTYYFAAPEVFIGQSTITSEADYYSLGVTLFNLWRSRDNTGDVPEVTKEFVVKGTRVFKEVGEGISGVIDEFKPAIHAAIQELMAYQPKDRKEPALVLKNFEQIFLEYKLKIKNVLHLKHCLEKAKEIAEGVNTGLRSIRLDTTKEPLLTLQNLIDTAVGDLKDLIDQNSQADKEELRREVTAEFIDVLNINGLKPNVKNGYVSLDDIPKLTKQIIEDFKDKMELALNLSYTVRNNILLLNHLSKNTENKNMINELGMMYEKIYIILYKFTQREITFDDLIAMNEKCQQLFKLQQQLLEFETQIDKSAQFNMETYQTIFRVLRPMPIINQVENVKNIIKEVIASYVEETLPSLKTKETHLLKLKTEILNVVNAIDGANTLEDLELAKLRKNHTSFFSRPLEKKLNIALTEHRQGLNC